MEAMKFSLVLPAYNEAAKLSRDLTALSAFLNTQPFSSEVLIVDDGSEDGTKASAQALVASFPSKNTEWRVLGYPKNRGKGYAVRFGIQHATGDIIAFADFGLCVPFRYLLVGREKIGGGFDFAIASRRVHGARIERPQPLYRRLGSRLFWWMMRALMGIESTDTQCGFKIYSRDAARKIFSRVETDGFMFDIEALLIAKQLHLKGTEFPVEWSNDADTRYHPFWGTLRNMKELAKIRTRLLFRSKA